MLKLKLIKFKKNIGILKKLPRFLAERSFLTFLGLLFIFLSLGLIIFYHSYFFSSKSIDRPIGKEELLRLDTESRQKVFEEWARRNEKFQTADFKEYPDFFR